MKTLNMQLYPPPSDTLTRKSIMEGLDESIADLDNNNYIQISSKFSKEPVFKSK